MTVEENQYRRPTYIGRICGREARHLSPLAEKVTSVFRAIKIQARILDPSVWASLTSYS